MSSTLHFVPVALATTAAGYAMLRLGVRKGLLRARFESRRCAACGRRIETPVCPSCTRRR
jgi:hypothetical protein